MNIKVLFGFRDENDFTSAYFDTLNNNIYCTFVNFFYFEIVADYVCTLLHIRKSYKHFGKWPASRYPLCPRIAMQYYCLFL